MSRTLIEYCCRSARSHRPKRSRILCWYSPLQDTPAAAKRRAGVIHSPSSRVCYDGGEPSREGGQGFPEGNTKQNLAARNERSALPSTAPKGRKITQKIMPEPSQNPMRWDKLLEKRCPACGRKLKLADTLGGEIVVCPDLSCGFAIGREKFDDVCADILARREERSPDKLRDF